VEKRAEQVQRVWVAGIFPEYLAIDISCLLQSACLVLLHGGLQMLVFCLRKRFPIGRFPDRSGFSQAAILVVFSAAARARIIAVG
jgi:hypothetical protein